MDDLSTLFSLNNWPGHLSYVLIAISYWLTDIFWLRTVAVIGLSLEILYFWFSGGDLRAGIGWDLIFIAINLYQIYRLVKDRLSLRLPEADRDLLRGVLKGLDDAQIARLLHAGAFLDLRQVPAHPALDPDETTGYPLGNALAEGARACGLNGIIYPSVRHARGTCIAALRPAAVQSVRQGDIYRMTWRGDPTPTVEGPLTGP